MASMAHAPRAIECEIASRRLEQLVYRIRGLRFTGNVLHIGAHPDDEDAGLLAYMARKYSARTVYWSATRGEAGQNRIGAYTGDALGIYRTWESLAARAVDGGESLYGPFIDFGFSKNGTEATAKWGRHELVREIVRAIRLVQPQIVIARFTGGPSDGHGQHQAIGSATVAAFAASADANLFPELNLPAWQAAKFYQSTGGDWQPGEEHNIGRRQPEFECDGYLAIDTGELDPIAGLTYQQQASVAFNSHQTQAMGFLPRPGSFHYYYRLKESRVAGCAREESFYDGLDPTLTGLSEYPGGGPSGAAKALEKVQASVDAALQQLRPHDPSAAAEPLLDGLETLRRLRAQIDSGPCPVCYAPALSRLLDHKIAGFEDAISGCLGFDAECIGERAHVRSGESFRVTATLWNPRRIGLDSSRFRMILPDGWREERVGISDDRHQTFDIVSPENAVPTTPYWLRKPHDRYRYNVDAGSFDCKAFGSPDVALECEFSFGGHRLTIRRPALRREPFAGGYRELPISLLPATSVKPQVCSLFLPLRQESCDIDLQAALVRLVGHGGELTELRVEPPDGWTVNPPLVHLHAGAEGETATARFKLTIPAGTRPGRYRVEYRLGSGEGQPAVTLEPVRMGAPGLLRPPDAGTCVREAFVAKAACVHVHMVSAKFAAGMKYGYVRGAAEGLLDSLGNLGLSIHLISDEEMDYIELPAFDAIVIGPNAYHVRDELRRNAGRFLEYVFGGGTLIVQYQAYGYELHDFAPYPFDYSHPHDRVTYADAPVTIIEPQHPLMTHPNRITEEDFNGWVHDRGLYFFGSFDSRYTAILGCNDPGEDLKRGGLLAAAYGRGAFVYVGYSLFRQIPGAVPGAFRLLANLLALPEALLLERVERLRRLSFFSNMNDEQLLAVAKIVSERHEKSGTYLCRQGDPGQELFIVIKGEVEIVKRTAHRTVHLKASEGQVIGEFAILADIPRAADLRAATDVQLLVISRVHFRELIRQYAEISENMIRQLVMKLIVE